MRGCMMIETDVLIIGSGGAGLRSAIEAVNADAKTTLVTKGTVNRSGASPLAGADIMLDGRSLHELGYPANPDDSPEKWFRDICVEGFYLNNQHLVENYVRDAPKRFKELIEWGMKIDSSEEREVLTSGVEIINALYRELSRHKIDLFEDVMVCDLLTNEQQVVGAIGVDIYTGELITFKAKAIVLATGGWMKAYPYNSITGEMNGDGQAMAYRAGAELSNMEFVTFCPNVLLTPKILRGCIFFYVFHHSCGTMLNSEGTDILAKYDPKIAEIATKTEWNKLLLSLYTMREVMDGKGTPNGGVYFSLKDVPWDIVEKHGLTRLAPNWKYQDTDLKNLMESLKEGASAEVGAVAHYVEGGVHVTQQYEASINGLFVAGEVCSGTFGANRVSAATTQMLVEGALAGRYAALYAIKTDETPVDKIQLAEIHQKLLAPIKREIGIKPVIIRKKLHSIANEFLGVIRTGDGLLNAIKQLDQLKKSELQQICVLDKSRIYNLEWIDALELENMLQILELSAKAALMRTESRGVHYRLDFPNVDHDNWLKEVIVKKSNGGVHLTTNPIIVTKITPPKGVIPFEKSILDAITQLQE